MELAKDKNIHTKTKFNIVWPTLYLSSLQALPTKTIKRSNTDTKLNLPNKFSHNNSNLCLLTMPHTFLLEKKTISHTSKITNEVLTMVDRVVSEEMN